MKTRIGRFLASALILGTIVTAGATAPAGAPATGPLAVLPVTQIHMKRLHIARPDLIQYPTGFEVYC